jgi:hypothetical protein
MPLLKYFVVIGVLLTALLFAVDALLEPNKAHFAKLAAERGDVNLPKPKIRSRVGQRVMGVPERTAAPVAWERSFPASDIEPRGSESTAEAPVQPAAVTEPNRRTPAQSAKKARSKTAKARTRRHIDVARDPNSTPGYFAYAEERAGWPFRIQPRARQAHPFLAQSRPMQPFFAPQRPAPPFFAQR